ncbi:unnamed protein product [Staurois parvus]|uniref:S100/CaBP-9k-type calcium binding subdomain domain-containing protein n=1 Tax=Staurois parvus TaxID=386267 RepID=A0ABN9BGI5_9NEOB|nr:unnamed protein product [Staurois parvus]
MVNIIQVFHSYSGKDCKLKKKDLKELINSQMSSFVKVSRIILYFQNVTRLLSCGVLSRGSLRMSA